MYAGFLTGGLCCTASSSGRNAQLSVPMALFSGVFRFLPHLHLAARCSGPGHRKELHSVCRLFHLILPFSVSCLIPPSLRLLSPRAQPHRFYFWRYYTRRSLLGWGRGGCLPEPDAGRGQRLLLHGHSDKVPVLGPSSLLLPQTRANT